MLTFVDPCRSSLRFSKSNFLSFRNETVTSAGQCMACAHEQHIAKIYCIGQALHKSKMDYHEIVRILTSY